MDNVIQATGVRKCLSGHAPRNSSSTRLTGIKGAIDFGSLSQFPVLYIVHVTAVTVGIAVKELPGGVPGKSGIIGSAVVPVPVSTSIQTKA